MASNAKRALGLDESTKIWHATVSPSPEGAAEFVNRPPAQGAGEAAFSNRSDGSVDVYYYL
ncbi:hypothetical protein [Nonomuraea sp. NPDC050643]|uniref:hypothetical protein n=1 Tax=Nonomuraea sp. NPDC050643 TaxID=3155660 RepID=UPI00340FF81F